MDEGLLILRLVVGLTMAAHGSQKLFGWFGGGRIEGTAAYFGSLGYRAPATFALLAGLTEFLGGLAIAVGFLVPLAAMGIAVVMLNAIESVKFPNGFWAGNGGYELEFLLLSSVHRACDGGTGTLLARPRDRVGRRAVRVRDRRRRPRRGAHHRLRHDDVGAGPARGHGVFDLDRLPWARSGCGAAW